MNIFAKSFKKYLIDHDISQNEIADNCGLSKQAISNLFNRDNLSLDKILMLADAAHCNIDFIFTPKE